MSYVDAYRNLRIQLLNKILDGLTLKFLKIEKVGITIISLVHVFLFFVKHSSTPFIILSIHFLHKKKQTIVEE